MELPLLLDASQVNLSPEWVMLRMFNVKLMSDSCLTNIEEEVDITLEPFCRNLKMDTRLYIIIIQYSYTSGIETTHDVMDVTSPIGTNVNSLPHGKISRSKPHGTSVCHTQAIVPVPLKFLYT